MHHAHCRAIEASSKYDAERWHGGACLDAESEKGEATPEAAKARQKESSSCSSSTTKAKAAETAQEGEREIAMAVARTMKE